ncbi:MAG: response regulator transcription factor [Ignavibacteria bacterium]
MSKVKKKIKIFLVDDHPLVKIGLKSELKKNKDFLICGDAANGKSAVLKILRSKPDVILMDISLPDVNGMEITPHILKKLPGVKVLTLTMQNNINYIEEMMKMGASGYVLKDSPLDDLIEGIYEVQEGNKYFCSGSQLIINKETNKRKVTQNQEILTTREKQILTHIAQGESNKDIADKLFLSVRTIEAHRNNIKIKLKLGTVADFTKYAILKNLIKVD